MDGWRIGEDITGTRQIITRGGEDRRGEGQKDQVSNSLE